MNCYPSTGGKELEGFTRIALEALAPEPDAVLIAMTHPRTGVVAKCKFLPTIAELLAWCEGERVRLAQIEREEARIEQERLLRLVPPKELPEAEKARRRAFTAKCQKQLADTIEAASAAAGGTKKPKPIPFVEWSALMKHEAKKPVYLSDEALRLVGVTQSQQ